MTRVHLAGPQPSEDQRRSWWLREALAADPGISCPPLTGNVRADVVILGGGYTGLWTALHLKCLDPATDIVVLEADICGSGPSGRNGGFMYGLWEDLAELTRRFGPEEALRTCLAADAMVEAAAQTFADAGIDVWFRRAGHLCVSTSPMYDAVLHDAYAGYADYPGVPDGYFHLLDADAVTARVRSPRFRGALWGTRTATVQPARLARGLRRLCLEAGVRIYEHSPVTDLTSDGYVRATTPTGSVVAAQGVLGLNAWSDQVPGIGRRIVSRASHIVLTEPAPELLKEIGWTGWEALDDFRSTVDYVRTTNDGRIAFGQGTGDAAHANTPRLAHDPEWQRRIAQRLIAWFPEFRDVGIEASWGGPVDVAASHLPFVGRLGAGNLHFAAGYSGSGVGASVLCGRILASQVLRRDDEYATLPLARYRPQSFPMQPFLGLGARIVLPAIVRTEDAWEADRAPGRISRFLAGMPRRIGYNLGP